MYEPGRAAWVCPGCGFVIGWIDEDNNLVIWRYPAGFVSIKRAIFTCSCGYVHRWNTAKASSDLDNCSVPVV